MIQIIVSAFVEDSKENAIVEVVFASADHDKVQEKYQELIAQFHNNYLVIYDLPLDTNLNEFGHYPSVSIGKEEFRV